MCFVWNQKKYLDCITRSTPAQTETWLFCVGDDVVFLELVKGPWGCPISNGSNKFSSFAEGTYCKVFFPLQTKHGFVLR